MIEKPVAIGFVIFNSVYIIICIVRFFYTGDQVIINFNNPPTKVLSDNSLWVITPRILYIIIFVGLLWLLRIFKEKFWIQLSVIMFIILKIATLLIVHFNNSQYLFDHAFLFDIVNVGNFATMLYMLIALFRVKGDEIKLYFRWFVILIVLSILLSRLGQILYDDFSIHSLLVNSDVLTELCFVLTLVLFVKIFRLSLKSVSITT